MVLPGTTHFNNNDLMCKISGAMGNFAVQAELVWINIFNYCIYKVLVMSYPIDRL